MYYVRLYKNRYGEWTTHSQPLFLVIENQNGILEPKSFLYSSKPIFYTDWKGKKG